MRKIQIPSNVAQYLIGKIMDFDERYPGALQPEFLDFLDVVEDGAKKYALNNWLLPNGGRCSVKENADSMFHHLAEGLTGQTKDKDSGRHPYDHLATRAIFGATRSKRGIKHDKD